MKHPEGSLKAIARKHKPIKLYLRSYLEKYEELFLPIRDDSLTILEFGVGGYKKPGKGGGSLRMWAEYFPNSTIVGVDINSKELEFPDNVRFHQGSQIDVDFINKLIADYGSFDIIIDDASHVTSNTIATFNQLWPETKDCYIVEDLHMKSATGTEEYFRTVNGTDFSTKNMCVIKKNKGV